MILPRDASDHEPARPMGRPAPRTPSILATAAWCLLGTALAAGVFLWVSPLWLLRTDPQIIRATAAWEQDLEAYRAAPLDFTRLATLRHALPAYEDRGFDGRYTWLPPVSPKGLGRAVLRNLEGVAEGGSTIPQQLGKLYLRDEGAAIGLRGKLEELLFATWLVRRAERDEILGIYLNLTASRGLGGPRDPVHGADQLSLAVFGLPIARLGREDQLFLAAVPRGLGWLRTRSISGTRILAARRWMIQEGHWDASVPSFMDGEAPLETAHIFGFDPARKELLATNREALWDQDLVEAIGAFRAGIAQEIAARHPGVRVRAAFAVIGDDTVLARSGMESLAMTVNYGSIAKVEPLAVAVEALGPERVRALSLEPRPCIRWYWNHSKAEEKAPSTWCPSDAGSAPGSMSFDEAVARSINTMCAAHLVALPYRFALEQPAWLDRVRAGLPATDQAALDSGADRAIAAGILQELGQPTTADEVPREISYTALELAWFRFLHERRQQAGLPPGDLPDDPTQLIGNSSRATAEQIGRYMHGRMFEPEAGCTLSDTGALLAGHRAQGTLRWLATKRPDLVFTGKTGTSPHDDAALASVSLCLDGRPVTLVGALRAEGGKLPDGFHGSVVLRGVERYLEALEALGRPPASPALPAWAQPEPEDTPPAGNAQGAGDPGPTHGDAPLVAWPLQDTEEQG